MEPAASRGHRKPTGWANASFCQRLEKQESQGQTTPVQTWTGCQSTKNAWCRSVIGMTTTCFRVAHSSITDQAGRLWLWSWTKDLSFRIPDTGRSLGRSFCKNLNFKWLIFSLKFKQVHVPHGLVRSETEPCLLVSKGLGALLQSVLSSVAVAWRRPTDATPGKGERRITPAPSDSTTTAR